MDRREILTNKAICVCVEARKAVERQTVKMGSANEKRQKGIIGLIFDTESILKKSHIERNTTVSLEYLEKGLNNICLIDLKMKGMKNIYSPVREIFPEIVKCTVKLAHDADNAGSVDDVNGIFIPFPSPEQFANLARQLFSRGGE
ncbi:MAG: hypothetical protein K0R00_12 [Herbinix sp.]|jgi:hypothetical protein|nr:hypothetical protein [Herbinix sp.]